MLVRAKLKIILPKSEKALSETPARDTKRNVNPNHTGMAKAIEIRDLHKSFGSLEVLKGISMDAHEGDVVAIIGTQDIVFGEVDR